jgi:hypothetical protein
MSHNCRQSTEKQTKVKNFNGGGGAWFKVTNLKCKDYSQDTGPFQPLSSFGVCGQKNPQC